ncbi:MAG TPA: hypothetical protein VGD00_06425 [Solirubrobacteraceae bacterium]
MACRGTGRVISNLGGTPSTVTCPWCEGNGLRPAEIDAQARWPREQSPESALAPGGGEPSEQTAAESAEQKAGEPGEQTAGESAQAADEPSPN